MGMPLPVPPTYTTDDLRAFPHDGCRYELLDGMLLVTPAPSNAHQVVLFRLGVAVANYLGKGGPGIAVSPGEIEIAPKVLLDPDLLVYSSAYRPGIKWTEIRGWWLAVEVFSRSSKRYDRDFKRDAYLALGVREVWLVDPREECIHVSRAGERRDVRQAEHLIWHPAEMAEPLTIDLPELFQGP